MARERLANPSDDEPHRGVVYFRDDVADAAFAGTRPAAISATVEELAGPDCEPLRDLERPNRLIPSHGVGYSGWAGFRLESSAMALNSGVYNGPAYVVSQE